MIRDRCQGRSFRKCLGAADVQLAVPAVDIGVSSGPVDSAPSSEWACGEPAAVGCGRGRVCLFKLCTVSVVEKEARGPYGCEACTISRDGILCNCWIC